jgi:hypothetical protein
MTKMFAVFALIIMTIPALGATPSIVARHPSQPRVQPHFQNHVPSKPMQQQRLNPRGSVVVQ